MNRTLKRVLGLAGSVAVGLVGAVAIGSAAQAHHSDVSGAPTCLPDGNWQVTWTVTDGEWAGKDPNLEGWITKVTSSHSDVEITGDFSVDTTAAEKVYLPEKSGTPLQATQVFDASVDEAWLKVASEWDNQNTDETEKIKVYKPDTGCEPEPEPETPDPGLSDSSDCFGIEVTATNGNAEALSTFTFTPSSGGEAITATPEVGEPFVYDFFVQDVEAGLTVTVVVDGGEPTEIVWEGAEDCPVIESTATCDGLEVTLTVPEGGTETVFTFTTAEGDEQKLTLAPGASGTVFIAGVGTELEIFYKAEAEKFYETNTLTWAKPAECEEVPPSEAPTTPQAQLPQTGSSAMPIIIGSAAALVVAAAVLFFIARRRRAAADW